MLSGMLSRVGLSVVISALFGDASTVLDVGGLSGQLLELSYSRTLEREADAVGHELLRSRGYSTTGYEAFFQRLSDVHGDPGMLALLGTHPASAERVEFAREHRFEGASPLSANDLAMLRTACPAASPARP